MSSNSKAKPTTREKRRRNRSSGRFPAASVDRRCELEVAFANERPGMTAERIRLPELFQAPDRQELRWRGGLAIPWAGKAATMLGPCDDVAQGADARAIFDAGRAGARRGRSAHQDAGRGGQLSSMLEEKIQQGEFRAIDVQCGRAARRGGGTARAREIDRETPGVGW